MNMITNVLDSLKGTQHYIPMVDSLAKAAITAITVNGARIEPAKNLDSETFGVGDKGEVDNGKNKKKTTTPPQETLAELGFKKDFVYMDGDSGIYAKINTDGKGRGSITLIGYDKDSPMVKAAFAEDALWVKKYETRSTITGVKATRLGLKNPYMRSMENWSEVCAYSDFVRGLPASFAPMGDFDISKCTFNPDVVGAEAETANLVDEVQLSIAS